MGHQAVLGALSINQFSAALIDAHIALLRLILLIGQLLFVRCQVSDFRSECFFSFVQCNCVYLKSCVLLLHNSSDFVVLYQDASASPVVLQSLCRGKPTNVVGLHIDLHIGKHFCFLSQVMCILAFSPGYRAVIDLWLIASPGCRRQTSWMAFHACNSATDRTRHDSIYAATGLTVL